MDKQRADLFSHPIIGSPSAQRVLAMDKTELRLLDNAKKGLADCDALIETEWMEDYCIDKLLKGLDAARKLRQKLSGKTTEQDSRKNFVALLETSIPSAIQSGKSYEIRRSKTGKMSRRSVSEIIYDEVRCLVVHENDNLNEAELEGIDYPVKLRWGILTETLVLSCDNGVMIINGMLLLRRLRENLSHYITSLEAMKSFAQTGKATITIYPPIGSVQPNARKRKT